MDNYFLITGMFRSGTTLVSKILDAHAEIVCMPDVFTPFFNAFRDDVAESIGMNVDPLQYIKDYFSDQNGIELLKMEMSSSLDREFNPTVQESLVRKIKDRSRMTCPNISRKLTTLEGKTYKEVFVNLISYIQGEYGDGSEVLVGHKEVWITEFIPVLARAFPGAKFIIVNRDPRAVCASKNVASVEASDRVKEEKYPWLFLIRQWRKLAILAWTLKEYSDFKERIFCLKYEDLIADPEDKIEELCEFLGVVIRKSMLDPETYRDGNSGKWIQNSSYNCIGKDDGFLVFESKKSQFDKTKIDKWKEVLSTREVEYIEQLCYPEMKLYGYAFAGTGVFGIPEELQVDPPVAEQNELQEWIKNVYKDYTRADLLKDMESEKLRQQLLNFDERDVENVDGALIESYFYDTRYYRKARSLL